MLDFSNPIELSIVSPLNPRCVQSPIQPTYILGTSTEVYPKNPAGLPPQIPAEVHTKMPSGFPPDISACISPKMSRHFLPGQLVISADSLKNLSGNVSLKFL